MKCVKIFFACVVLSAAALPAQQIPVGTALPVMLNSTFDAKKEKPGQRITARIMQDVPLPGGDRIPAGSRVVGRVLAVSGPTAASGSRLVLKFDRLSIHGRSSPITTNLRAIASMTEVFDAQLPTNNFDEYGTSIADWTTIQVGGDAVYRGNGQVIAADNRVVGTATIGGDVTAKLTAVPDRGCRGSMGGNDSEQALWVLSTSACGAYGFRDLKIVHAGRTPSVGEIMLESTGNLMVRGGSGLLLRVDRLISAPANTTGGTVANTTP
jgi:hypothetical protein